MAQSKTAFEQFIMQEVEKSKMYFPVKTGVFRRWMTKKAYCKDLHPNPDDGFCKPEIGPSYRIIEDYYKKFRNYQDHSDEYFTGDPIIVERTHPDGYRIINGHHRWAAALRLNQKKIPIQIVNLIHEADVRKILENTKHTKRVALDLDEVVFREEKDGPLEKAVSFPWNRIYKERIRSGIPALFHFLKTNGYDIWLYSNRYFSTDYIQNYFRRYHVEVDGVIAALEKRAESAGDAEKSLERLIVHTYQYTLHLDNDMVLQIFSGSKEFREFSLSGGSEWAQEVMDVITKIEEQNKEAETRA